MRFESLHEPTAKRRRSEDMTTTRVFAPCKIPTNNFKDILELRKLLHYISIPSQFVERKAPKKPKACEASYVCSLVG